MSIFNKFFDSNQKQVKRLESKIALINDFEDKVSKLSDDDIRTRIQDIIKKISKTKDDDIEKVRDEFLEEVFAIVRESAKRSLNHRHYDVQLMAGLAMAQGRLVELLTGEGKTLVATLPLTLYSLFKKGAHIVTVNDYLAKRDAEWCGHIYSFLGLSIGVVTSDKTYKFVPLDKLKEYGKTESEIDALTKEGFRLNSMHGAQLFECTKKEAYECDITYGTNNDFGFDYLRDNLVYSKSDFSQRELFFCIVDEADSVLIDESRTPLIISDPVESDVSSYTRFSQIAQQLNVGDDYILDEKIQSVTLTESGIDKIEKIMNVDDIWNDYKNTYHLENALKAKSFFIKDDEYLVKDGKVIIVDEFTGRIMPDRRFSEGLHQAIEAKEGVEILQESRTLATITFQNFFRLYKYLAGMTGTAMTEAEEFFKIYHLDVIAIPPNRPNIRIDYADRVYRNKDAKFRAVIEEIKENNKKGRPLLVGTTSVDTSEYLSNLLSKEGILHTVLNAKYHEQEAEIISHAGEKGQVTIATNMAGRGTDIVLGDGVKELGGLHVIGTQRHESRRIDNQLRGRTGRQGDPGSARFYVSLDDDLMRIFGGESVARILSTLKVDENVPIEAGIISKQIESSQKKIEAYNFDTRKSLVDYDDVMNKHREVVFRKRKKFLNNMEDEKFDYKKEVLDKINAQLENLVNAVAPNEDVTKEELDTIINDLYAIIPKEIFETVLKVSGASYEEWMDLIFKQSGLGKSKVIIKEDLLDQLQKIVEEVLLMQEEVFTKEIFRQIMKDSYLQVLSYLWTDHIDAMDYLKQSIGLQGYAQVDPLVAYKQEAFSMFDRFINAVEYEFARRVFYVQKVEVQDPAMIENLNDIQSNLSLKNGDNRIKTINVKNPITSSGASEKIGRNDPCFCGSGKKYKNCHGKVV